MGFEYGIGAKNGRWPLSQQETANWLLHLVEVGRLPGAVETTHNAVFEIIFEFRINDSSSDWPDVVVGVQPSGLYLCDNGTREFDNWLGRLMCELAARLAEAGVTFYEL